MKKLALALIVTAAASQASAVSLNLVSMETQNWDKYQDDPATGHSMVDLSDSAATWSFDGSTLSGSGILVMGQSAGPTPMFANLIGDFNLDLAGTGAASASTYECVEQVFGSYIGMNMCASTMFGTNGANDSSVAYNIGGDASNQSTTVGGDDVFAGPAQALSDYDMVSGDDNAAYAALVNGAGQLGITSYSWDGTNLVINNLYGNTTKTMTFSAVPVPAAAWLFGSALLGLAGVKRSKK